MKVQGKENLFNKLLNYQDFLIQVPEQKSNFLRH